MIRATDERHPMSETEHAPYRVQVEFGDCDPARIVYFPNFFRWSDAASRHFFRARGIPSWEQTEVSHGIIGTPCVNAQARFIATASYGDVLLVSSRIAEWRNKSFVFRHRIMRGEQPIAEVEEVRIFARRAAAGGTAIQAVEIPPEWRALCA
jgi:4-hydroxybenzoyl-CoA thioesterase